MGGFAYILVRNLLFSCQCYDRDILPNAVLDNLISAFLGQVPEGDNIFAGEIGLAVCRHNSFRNNADLFGFQQSLYQNIGFPDAYGNSSAMQCVEKFNGLDSSAPGGTGEIQEIPFLIMIYI